MTTELHPPRVLVTGGSGGIGAAICHHFLDTGHEVINVSRERSPFQHVRLASVVADLSDSRTTQQVFANLSSQSSATVLVHCAGAVHERPLEEVTPGDLTAAANLHIGAAVSLVQANLAAMKQARFGRIILVSTRAILGLAKRTAYAATKAGLIGLTRTWALELAQFGITANAVAPGPIAGTTMFHEVVPEGSEKQRALAQAVPVGRLGTPADVAEAVLFFANPTSSFITGQTLFVCGGTSVGSLPL